MMLRKHSAPRQRSGSSSSFRHVEPLEHRWYFNQAPVEVTALDWRSSAAGDATVLTDVRAGETIYVRADVSGTTGSVINVAIWEDDGNADTNVANLAITVNDQGFGTAPWTATWDGSDTSDPFNQYYLRYGDSTTSADVYSGSAGTGHFLVRPPRASVIAGGASRPGHQPSPVVLERFDSSAAVDPALTTWIVMHGRASSSSSPFILDLATAVAQQEVGQILTLDWSRAASAAPGTYDFTGEDWIQPVARWTANVLQTYGFNGESLNLIGHSWGSLVSDETAERLAGGANTIIALDPAENAPDWIPFLVDGGAYDADGLNEIDFRAHSSFSWAFYSRDGGPFGGGIPGSETTAPTADESFVVRNSEHTALVSLFTSLLNEEPGGIGDHFKLDRLLAQAGGGWAADRFDENGDPGGPYEAVIFATDGGLAAELLWYLSAATMESTAVWNLAQGNYALSNDLGTSASFVTVAVYGSEVQVEVDQNLSSLVLRNDASVTLTPGGQLRLTSAALTIDSTSILDVSDNVAILTAAPEDAGATLRKITAHVASARNAQVGRWLGPGITSSTAATGPLTTVAVGLIGDVVVVGLTWNGDANLDGKVNADDYFRIDSGFLSRPSDPLFSQGDFNYDGRIDVDDYFLIDSAFLGQGEPLAGTAPVASALATSTAASPISVERERRTSRKRAVPSIFSDQPVSVLGPAGRQAVARRR